MLAHAVAAALIGEDSDLETRADATQIEKGTERRLCGKGAVLIEENGH
jgi:hypothetical protein